MLPDGMVIYGLLMEYIEGWQLDSDVARQLSPDKQIEIVICYHLFSLWRSKLTKPKFLFSFFTDSELSSRRPCSRCCRHQPTRLASRSDTPLHQSNSTSRPCRANRFGFNDSNLWTRTTKFHPKLLWKPSGPAGSWRRCRVGSRACLEILWRAWWLGFCDGLGSHPSEGWWAQDFESQRHVPIYLVFFMTCL